MWFRVSDSLRQINDSFAHWLTPRKNARKAETASLTQQKTSLPYLNPRDEPGARLSDCCFLTQAIRKYCEDFSESAISEVVTQVDKEAVGQIDFDDFLAYLSSPDPT